MSEAPTGHPGLPMPRRAWAIAGLALGSGMAIVNATGVNVALPLLARDLSLSDADAVSVVTSYQVILALALLPISVMGERFHFKRVYLCGVILFVAASLACALAPSLPWLVAARTAQALGASGVIAVSGASLRLIYPASRLGQGLGIHSAVVAGATAAGPSIAAAVLSVTDWRWLFTVNLPLGLVALVLALTTFPANVGRRTQLPVISATLGAASLGFFLWAINGLSHGEAAWLAAPKALAGGACAWLLTRRQAREAEPFLPAALFTGPVLRLSLAASVINFMAQMSALVTLPFLLQARFGLDVGHIGLAMTAWPAAAFIVGPTAGHFSDRLPPALLGLGGLLLAAGSLAAIGLSSQLGLPAITALLALTGAGFATFQIPNNRLITTSAPMERSGVTGGLIGTARLSGQSVGAALVALTFQAGASASEAPGLLLAAGLALAAAAMSATRGKARPT